MSNKKERSFFQAPKTSEEIDQAARDFRQKLGIDERLIPNMYEILPSVAKITGFRIKEVTKHPRSPRVRAWTDANKKILYITHAIKESLKIGENSARETIAHELGHIVLGHEGVRYDIQDASRYINTKDELDAANFARRFLAPSHLLQKTESARHISQLFHVTPRTAHIRFNEQKTDEAREENIDRSLTLAGLQVALDLGDGDKASQKTRLLSKFELFRGNGGGIEEWFSDEISHESVEALTKADSTGLTFEVLNQLIVLAHDTGMSKGFFNFYFLTDSHPRYSWYDPKRLPDFDRRYLKSKRIINLQHLRWGLYRLYIDALLFFGNIRQGYRVLSAFDQRGLEDFFSKRLTPHHLLPSREGGLPLRNIPRDDRYLIAEKACKTYQPADPTSLGLTAFLIEQYQHNGQRASTLRELIESTPQDARYSADQILFSLDEVLDAPLSGPDSIPPIIEPELKRFQSARKNAQANTKLYLSMSQELDIYVATSMRKREEFTAMANFCDTVFKDRRLTDLSLRYFDPTLSAAESHEDKGLIECLMVDCAKMLVYIAGEADSFGKAAEAAMALSKGKPVVFYCQGQRMHSIYRDMHPLSRLINFENGVAVGAMVATTADQIVELISRTFRDEMEFELVKKKENYFLLVEKLTGSTVRLQTDDPLIRETFWNYYKKANT